VSISNISQLQFSHCVFNTFTYLLKNLIRILNDNLSTKLYSFAIFLISQLYGNLLMLVSIHHQIAGGKYIDKNVRNKMLKTHKWRFAQGYKL